jgi:hypothetical protein
VDRIEDFASGLDQISFSLSLLGVASASISLGGAPDGTEAQIVYDAASGILGWYAAGSGGAGVTLAVLAGTPTLTAGDIVFVA